MSDKVRWRSSAPLTIPIFKSGESKENVIDVGEMLSSPSTLQFFKEDIGVVSVMLD